MFMRKIGRILRGSASPAQLMFAAVLGTTLGFMPGFSQAGGLILLMSLLLILLNANLALAAMLGALAKLVSLLVMPLSFRIGGVLLDGPTQPLFKSMINAPVLALFGFEYYATTGGLVLGLIFGLLVGFLIVSVVRTFRHKMANLQEGSDRFRQFLASRWVRLAMWLFVGGGANQDYKELLARRGKLIRPIGAAFAVLVIVLLLVVQQFFAGPIITAALKNGLEYANGATVDVDSAEVSLAEGRMTVNGLGMADPNALSTNLLEAERVEVDLSGFDLLRKRITLDRLVLVGGRNGMPRSTPGRLLRARPEPSPAPEIRPGEKGIDDYLVQAELWKSRLAQVRQWLDKLAGPESPAAQSPQEQSESLRERLEREVREKGYTEVAASHLIEGSPLITVIELVAEKVRTSQIEGETLDIRGGHLSTQPHLLDQGPSLSVKSSGGSLDFGVELGSASKSRGESQVALRYAGLPVDKVASQLPAVQNQPPIAGGTMDLSLEGRLWTSPTASIDMPLTVTLHNTTVSVPQAGQAPVEKLILPLQLRGPIDNPRITLSDDVLANALKQAGAELLASKVRAETDKATEKAVGELTKKLDDKVGDQVGKEIGGKAKGLLEGVLGGKKEKKDD
jgi:uncharacterized protein (TIGR03546 family)